MTMASLPIGWKATQPPSAKPVLQRDAVERHFEIGAREAHAVDAA